MRNSFLVMLKKLGRPIAKIAKIDTHTVHIQIHLLQQNVQMGGSAVPCDSRAQ